LHLERDAVALPLLAHVAQRVLGAALVELVEHHQLGEVEHVDLLELARRAEVAGHHVHREIDQVDDLRIALADAGGLDDHQVVAQRLEEGDAVLQHAGWWPRSAGAWPSSACTRDGLRSEFMRMRSPSSAPPVRRRVGSTADHRDVHLREAGEEAVEQLVGHRGLARAAGAGDADDRCLSAGQLPLLAQVREFGFLSAVPPRSR
jgi:hypothetical protein